MALVAFNPGAPIATGPAQAASRCGRRDALQRLAALQLYFQFVFPHDDGEWASDELAMLRQMRGAGKSYAECARAISRIGPGRTRNACISKAWRLGLYAPPTGDDPTLMLARRPLLAKRMQDWNEEAPAADVIAIPSAGKSFLELGPRDCRWPFGEGRRMRFCGCPQAHGSAYCAEHAAVAAEPQNSVTGPA